MNVKIEKIPSKLNVYFLERKIEMALDEINKISAYWKKINIEGKFFNGEVFSIHHIEKKTDQMNIFVHLSDYAHYLYTSNHFTDVTPCQVIFIVVLIETSDYKYVIGRMGKHTSSSFRFQCPGGGLEKNDIVNSEFDLKSNLTRELFEETGINLNDSAIISNYEHKFIKTGGTGGFLGVIAKLKLKVNQQIVEKIFEEHQLSIRELGETPELDSIIFVDKFGQDFHKYFVENNGNTVDYLIPLLNADVNS